MHANENLSTLNAHIEVKYRNNHHSSFPCVANTWPVIKANITQVLQVHSRHCWALWMQCGFNNDDKQREKRQLIYLKLMFVFNLKIAAPWNTVSIRPSPLNSTAHQTAAPLEHHRSSTRYMPAWSLFSTISTSQCVWPTCQSWSISAFHENVHQFWPACQN